MARDFGSNITQVPQAPKVPRTKEGSRPDKRSPLAGPDIALPDPEKDREDRWRLWQQRPGHAGTGSILEFICWEYLVKTKKLREGVDFQYQVPFLGGRTQFGGFVADFYLPAKKLVWNPAGLQFHWTGPKERANDKLSTVLLRGKGVKQVFLYEDDLLQRPRYTLDKAWNGEQVSRTGI